MVQLPNRPPIGSINDTDSNGNVKKDPRILIPEDILGRTFLGKEKEDGQRQRLKVVEQLDKLDATKDNDPKMIRFQLKANEDEQEEIMTYNKILQHIKDQYGEDVPEHVLWKFKSIIAHKGPLTADDDSYKG